jgi:hypothetical protein
MKTERIIRRIEYYQGILEKLYAAYDALISGGVQSYTIDDRTLTRLDLKALGEQIEEYERKLDELEAMLDGGKSRKAVAVVPHDW